MIFDLIRNGKAHQYQSAILRLDGNDVDLGITGPRRGRMLSRRRRRRSSKHLLYMVKNGDLGLYIRTDQLFLDIKKAIKQSGVISSSDVVDDIARQSGNYYQFKVLDLATALKNSGHKQGT